MTATTTKNFCTFEEYINDEGLYEEAIFTGEQNLISPTFTELKLTSQAIFAVES